MKLKYSIRSIIIALCLLVIAQLLRGQSPGGVSAGLGAWWKADYSASGTAWSDASGKGHHAALAGGSITYSANGGVATNFNPMLTSNGGYMSYTNPIYTSSATYDNMDVFTVIQPVSGEHCIPWGEDGNNGGYQTSVYHYGGDNNLHFQAPYSYDAYAAFTGTYGVSNLAEGWKSGTAMRLYQQGKQIAAYTTGGGGYYSTGTYNYLFAQPYRTTTGNSGTSEIIAYNTPLSPADRLRVNSYLAVKYGITLDQATATNYVNSSGTVIWDATANSAYKNNIAGIGRDGASALYQRQSRSVNSGNQVVISLGTVAASNAANTGSFSTDNQFLIWGDNGMAGNTSFSAVSPYTNRLQRVWKAQNTGSINQALQVLVPTALLSSAQKSALLYSTSSSFASGNELITNSGTTTINSVSYYIYNLSAAQINQASFYFTLAYYVPAPGGVSGATSWFKVDAGITLNGSNVSAWANQVANANLTQLTQATSIRQPGYSSNGWNFNPNITYNQSILSATMPSVLNVAGAQTNDIFGALNYSSGGVYLQISDGGSGSNRMSLEYNTFQFPSGSYSITAGLAANKPSIFNASATSANQLFYTLNGNTPASGTYSGSLAAGTVLPLYSVGGLSNAYFFYGSFPEVATYNTSLTPTQKKQVQSYLAIKYGQTLAHDYIASDGATTAFTISGYTNNIAGIGRDDLTALNQKQSQSINSGSQVVMSLGTVATTNAANTGSFSADKQFLVWGDNNGSITTTTNLVGFLQPNQRFSRIWKLENTNSLNQQVTVYYPTAALNTALGSGTKYLVYDNAPGFNGSAKTAIASSGTTTINGTSYTAFTVTFPVATTLYFSFGSYGVPNNILVNPARGQLLRKE